MPEPLCHVPCILLNAPWDFGLWVVPCQRAHCHKEDRHGHHEGAAEITWWHVGPVAAEVVLNPMPPVRGLRPKCRSKVHFALLRLSFGSGCIKTEDSSRESGIAEFTCDKERDHRDGLHSARGAFKPLGIEWKITW